MDGKLLPVKVALRSRPLLCKELAEGCDICMRFIENEPQVVLGTDKAYTFDFTYHPNVKQQVVYDEVVNPLVEAIFKGYNATVLAYGQTGSGKTYSMGTVFDSQNDENNENIGIIPRAVKDIFTGIQNRNNKQFVVKITFLEIYKEEILDLLASGKRNRDDIAIREDCNGELKITNLTEITVASVKETFACLEQGSSSRSTGATAMNKQSSRSHAVFTVHIEQKDGDLCTTSKFHLVDLAGSERVKKTQAQGERFKEGVNINRGLLALGNVISALCEGKNRSHVPYRDSKLTRLLQDSLGGNSHTAMIACVSPADSNFEETLNTLRYADRARKIKNKPIINTDPRQAEIGRLKQLVQQLQMQSEPTEIDHIACKEIEKAKDTEIYRLTKELQKALTQSTKMFEKAIFAETARDRLNKKLSELSEKTGITVDLLNQSMNLSFTAELRDQLDAMKEVHDKVIGIQLEQNIDNEESKMFNASDSDEQEEENINTGEDTPRGAYAKEHTMKQAEMNRELTNLNRALALKEDLVSKLKLSETEYDLMKKQYEEDIEKMQIQIKDLQKQKEAVLKNPSRMGDQSSKRVQELENEIGILRKKINDQSKLQRLKEQSDEKVKKLHDEIQNMKQTRVKLIRQMRQDADKFRQWRQTKDREVARLKQQDRRRQFEFVRMEQTHSKQQNVMRRKMEEAVTANKRLKDALALRKSVADKRFDSGREQKHVAKIQAWVKRELELIASAKEAKYCLQSLMDDRKAIAEELNDLRTRLEEPPSKKFLGEESDASGDEFKLIAERIPILEKDQELRNVQISDLQQKLVDADQEEKRDKWEIIQNMGDAKQVLTWMFNEATNFKMEAAITANDQKELTANLEESKKSISELRYEVNKMENENKRLKQKHDEDLIRIARENEEKVIFLLRQLPKIREEDTCNASCSENSMRERLEFQEKEIANLSGIYDEFQKKADEVENLKRELMLVRRNGKGPYMPQLCDFSGSPAFRDITLDVEKKKKNVKKSAVSKNQTTLFVLEEAYDEDEDLEISDDKDDPDWRLSPIVTKPNQIDFFEKRSKIKPKRSSDSKCNCKGDCRTQRCSCKKGARSCSESCGCSFMCVNRDAENLDCAAGQEKSMNKTFTSSPSKFGLPVLSESNRLQTDWQNESSEEFSLQKKSQMRKRSRLFNSKEDFIDSD